MEWNQFLQDIKLLSNQIETSFSPDILVAIARGGWIPTRFLSDYLQLKNITSIGMHYTDKDRTQLVIYSEPSFPNNAKNILLVEDILETGKTIEYAYHYYTNKGYQVKKCALYITDETAFLPDFYVKKISCPLSLPWE